MKRPLMAGAAILVAWMLFDLIAHRFFLAPIYEANSSLWRPFDQMNVVLIYCAGLGLVHRRVAEGARCRRNRRDADRRILIR